MEIQLQNVNNQLVVSSREVAENFGKRHADVINQIDKIFNDENIRCLIFETFYNHRGNEYKEYLLTEKGLTIYLFNIQGYNDFKLSYINEFERMKQYLHDVKYRQGDKKHQLDCMERLGNLLPEELKQESLPFIKANTVVNKVVSNMYGFPKKLNKCEMNIQMLEDREKVMDDYLKLFEVFQSNTKVNELLNEKYQPKLLE